MQCLVALELKASSYKPEYAGKLGFYLELLDDFVRLPHENKSIGIVLCKDHKSFEVEYSLRSIKNPVGVADYNLEKALPDPKALQAELQRQLLLDEQGIEEEKGDKDE